MIKKSLGFIILLFANLFYAQDYYSELRKKYWVYEENDVRAFNYINTYINKAKKEKNYSELYQAYEDAIRYSPDKKLIYADSAISAAKLSNENDLIGSGHIAKGAVYYFNFRKFQPALNEYLLAHSYLADSEDKFLKNQNLYHIGVVKSYLGYNDEAMRIFKNCIEYFEPNTRGDLHPNLIINNTKGYLNSLHQMAVCYGRLNDFEKVEKICNVGLSKIPKSNFFAPEEAYFYKCLGINNFKQKLYQNAIDYFNKALPALKKKEDFTWISVIYFYQGNCYEKLEDEEKAIKNYEKVDSIFAKKNFLLPEIRENYEKLINYYKRNKNPSKQLYYTNQLLKVDSILGNDFKYLSTKIHKEYDTKSLIEAKEDLQNKNNIGSVLLLISVVLVCILAVLLYLWRKRKFEIQRKYEELLVRINDKTNQPETEPISIALVNSDRKTSRLDNKFVKTMLSKLSDFEKKNLFLEKGITLNKMAISFETNTSYISQIINDYKGKNFNSYINDLRIDYATQKIYNDKQWRKFSVEDLANEFGFSNRQSFSNYFFERNGIRPADFIKKRKEEIENSKTA